MTRFTRLIFDICDVMFSFLQSLVGGVTGICRAHAHQGKPNQQNQPTWFSCWINSCFLRASMTGPLQNQLKLLAAGLKTYEVPPDYSGNQSFSVCYVINNSVMCLKCNHSICAVFYIHRSGRNSIFGFLFETFFTVTPPYLYSCSVHDYGTLFFPLKM